MLRSPQFKKCSTSNPPFMNMMNQLCIDNKGIYLAIFFLSSLFMWSEKSDLHPISGQFLDYSGKQSNVKSTK